jgi:hypothetical protein
VQSSQSDSDVITCNSVPLVRQTPGEGEQPAAPTPTPGAPGEEFVYDLYYTNSQDFNFRMLESMLTIDAFGDELMFGDDRYDYMHTHILPFTLMNACMHIHVVY